MFRIAGVWLMHCHNEVHATQGMNIVLQVGSPDDWNLLENLPVCGSYHYSDPVRQGITGNNTNKANSMVLSLASVLLMAVASFIL